MLSALRRLFAPDPYPNLAEELRALQGRVRVLESERLELVTEWVKTRDQVLRFMKRAGAIRARLEENQEDEEEDDLVQRTLRLARGVNG